MLSQDFPKNIIITKDNCDQLITDAHLKGITIRIGLQTILSKNNDILSQKAIFFVPGVEYTNDGGILLDGLDYGKICPTQPSSQNVYGIMRFLNRLHWGDTNAFNQYVKTVSLPHPIVLDVAFYQKGKVKLNIVEIECVRVDRNYFYGIRPVSMTSEFPVIYPLPKKIRENVVKFSRWYRSNLKFYLNQFLHDAEHYSELLDKIYEDFKEDHYRLDKKEKASNVREDERKEFVEEYKKNKLIEALKKDFSPQNDYVKFTKPRINQGK